MADPALSFPLPSPGAETAAMLRQSQALKSAILEASLDAIITIDQDGTVLEINPATERIFGFTAAQMVGQEMAALIVPPSLREAHRHGMRHFLQTGEGPALGKRLELPAIRANGEEFPIELAITRIPLEGPPMFTGHIRDITERKAVEADLRRSRDEAERANGAKNEFLSRMSHELRTPLNAILGFAQVLDRTALQPPQAESVDHILRAGHHLLQLINEVLDLARIDSGQLAISLEDVNVEEIVREAVTLLQPACTARQLRVTLSAGVWHVKADRQRLKQVLVNVLSNAVKYNRAAGSIDVHCASVAGGKVAIAVRDSGFGMAPELVKRLFVPFERLGVESTGVEGTGIGLAISKRLVEAMGGTIEVESTVNEGSTFAVKLDEAATAPAREQRERPAAESAAAGAPRALSRVLYVEDNPANLRLMEKILAGQVELFSCARGEEALACALECRPALLLLDLHLPGLGGEEVLLQLRAEPSLVELPIIIVSADAMPRQIARLRSLGALDYLTKPLDIDTVRATVLRHLPEVSPAV